MNQYILGLMHGAALAILWTITITTGFFPPVAGVTIVISMLSFIFWFWWLLDTLK